LHHSEAFFDTYEKVLDSKSEIGNKAMPSKNKIEKSSIGI
jgi:hypothetical protein